MRFSQLDIFQSPDIGYNRAARSIISLEPEKAAETLDRWEKQYPGRRKLDTERRLISFLSAGEVRKAVSSNPERAFELWMDNWPQDKPPDPDSLIYRVRLSLFRSVADSMPAEPVSPSPFFMSGRAVLCLIWAEEYNRAVHYALSLVSVTDMSGRIYGYLGDALYGKGLHRRSRMAYFNALVYGREDLDGNSILDREIADLLENVSDYMPDDCASDPDENSTGLFNAGDQAQWAIVFGLLNNIFEISELKERSDVEWWKTVLKSGILPAGKSAPGLAFAAGMVLAHQNLETLNAFQLNLGEIRSVMKALSPGLFRCYMERLVL